MRLKSNRDLRTRSASAGWTVFLVGGLFLMGCGIRRHPVDTPLVTNSKQPDKELFDRGVDALEHSRFTVSRLTLQTLLNTYPDSEYVAKAKLGVADSWYREGGTSNLMQAESEYKDFITFFPTMPEAAEAQMRVAMIHYREMEKADRDSTQARRAEQEFQRLLTNFPDSPFAPLAVQRLREVQEILAEGQFAVAHFYWMQLADRAAQPRLKDLIGRYPNFSEADEALYMLGRSLERSSAGERNAEAASYYARIVKDYPLGGRADEARKRLLAIEAAVPEPDPVAVARMTYENSHRDQLSMRDKVVLAFRRHPSVAAAQGKIGNPTMTAQGAAEGESIPAALTPAIRGGPRQNSLSIENVPEANPPAK
jgi:outer membrane protein assembly factor BamD